jgi:U3 small nucleolar RNA-associated protein 16
MVTTRGGTETPGAPTPTPRSSTRKQVGKRELESLETPTQTKRQRKAPKATAKKGSAKESKGVDGSADEPSQDSSNDTSDTIAVDAPTSEAPQTPRQSGLPARQKSSPQIVVGIEASDQSSNTAEKEDDVPSTVQNPAFYTPAQAPGSVYATPATHKQPEGSPTPKAKTFKDQTPSVVAKKGRGRPKKTPQKDLVEISEEIPSSTFESEMAPIPSQNVTPTSAQPEKTHMRFGSEEPTPTQVSPVMDKQGNNRYDAAEPVVEAPQADDEKDEDASDSDDEAPEVVTTAAASSKALAARAEAERAQKAQKAKEEAKRKAREEFLAAQQAAKREREEKKAKKLAKKAAKEAKAAAAAADGPDADEDSDAEQRMNLDTSNGLLPASLLETIDDQRPPTPPPERRGKTEEERRKEKLNQHIKFLERTDKPVKDVKKGKLSVAVLAQQNKVMPPKMNRNSKSVREHWLKNRQVEKKARKGVFGKPGRMERRPHASRGFLRDGDD